MRALQLAVITLALAGCADAPTALSLDESLSLKEYARRNVRVRLFKASCETRFNAPPLPPPPVYRQVDTGECHTWPFGRMTVESVQDINFAAGTQSGERTFTARNGDKLYARHSGTSAPIAPGVIGFSATVTFVGGTGRFEGASGEATASGTATMATTTAVYEIAGALRLPNRWGDRDRREGDD